MINFMVHTPVNTRGYLMDYLKKNLEAIEKEIEEKIVLSTPHDYEHTKNCSESWVLPCVEDDKLPDIILTHAGEFSVLGDRKRNELFSNIAGEYEKKNPIRKELKTLEDPNGVFYPLFVVPIVMCYNKNKVKEEQLTGSWRDLFNKDFKVILPAKEKPLSKAMGGFVRENYPEEFEGFEEKIIYGNSPVDIVRSIATGEYDIAVTNISFAAMMKSKGVEINMPKEGVMLLPQVLLWKKNAEEKLLKIADILMESEIQNYLGEQGFWPVSEGTFLGDSITYDGMLQQWNGWDAYIRSIQYYENELEEA